MSIKNRETIIKQIEDVLNEFSEHLKNYGKGYDFQSNEEIGNVRKLFTRTKAVIYRAVGDQSDYYKDIEKEVSKEIRDKEQFYLVKGLLEGLNIDFKKNFVDLKGMKIGSIKFDRIIDEVLSLDPIYLEVVDEINATYKNFLFTSMYILIRKLLENLLYDCLKLYYGMSKSDIFFNQSKGRHHGYGTLIENFNQMMNESNFKTNIGEIEQKYIDLLIEFKEKGNINAHSLFNLPHQDLVEERKEKINLFIKKINSIIQSLK